MIVEYVACSVKGRRRDKNEDRIMVNDETISNGCVHGEGNNKLLALVCEGVGGSKGGAEAAEKISKSFEGFNIETCSPLSLARHIHRINRDIISEQRENKDFCNMASTAAGIVMLRDRFIAFNLGDTRIYKWCGGKFSLITKDHVESNQYNRLTTRNDTVTCYFGGDGRACFPSFRKGIIEAGSIYLLCSDGIYKKIWDVDLKAILDKDTSILEKEKAILKLSLKNGSNDDMSLVLIRRIA